MKRGGGDRDAEVESGAYPWKAACSDHLCGIGSAAGSFVRWRRSLCRLSSGPGTQPPLRSGSWRAASSARHVCSPRRHVSWRVSVTRRGDHYPDLEVVQYRRGERPHVIARDEMGQFQGDPGLLAVPFASSLFLPSGRTYQNGGCVSGCRLTDLIESADGSVGRC